MNTATPKTIEDLSKPAAAAAEATIIEYHSLKDQIEQLRTQLADRQGDLKRAEALNDAKSIENQDLRAEMKKLKLDADVAVGKRAELEAILVAVRAQVRSSADNVVELITDFVGAAEPTPQNGQDRAAELGRSLDVH